MAIKISLSDIPLLDNKVDAIVYFVEQDFEFSQQFKDLSKYVPNLDRLMKDRKFTGAKNSTLVIPLSGSDIVYFIFVGLGKKNKENLINFENYRKALGKLVRILPTYSIASLSMQLPDETLFGVSKEYIAQQTSMIILMADYIFDDFITDKDQTELDVEIKICVNSNNLKNLQQKN